jgi:hypothetical protein
VEALFQGTKLPEPEADHSFPSSAEVEDVWSFTSNYFFIIMAVFLLLWLYSSTASVV